MTGWRDSIWAWILGDLTPWARVVTALGPALILLAVVVLGLIPFAIRCKLKGMPVDHETTARGRSLLVGFFLRHYFFWLTKPLMALFLRSGIPANAVTLLSVLLGISAGVAVAAGRFSLGGWVFLLSGMLDALDGRLARVRGEASPAGSALDSVLDRVSDSAILVGLGWYYRDGWVLFPVLLALVGTSLVPYVRAKGESLGVPLRGGIMQRLERVLFLGGAVALSPVLEVIIHPDDPSPPHWIAVGGIVLVALLANWTGASRLYDLIKALRAKEPQRDRSTERAFAPELLLNGLAGALATAADYMLVIALVELSGLSPVFATALGCLLGAVVNFTFNRVITYRRPGAVGPQAARYGLVSGSSALLNAGGVAVLALHPLDYRLAWWLVRGAVWLFWNFPLQRSYVFARPAELPRTELGSSHAV